MQRNIRPVGGTSKDCEGATVNGEGAGRRESGHLMAPLLFIVMRAAPGRAGQAASVVNVLSSCCSEGGSNGGATGGGANSIARQQQRHRGQGRSAVLGSVTDGLYRPRAVIVCSRQRN